MTRTNGERKSKGATWKMAVKMVHVGLKIKVLHSESSIFTVAAENSIFILRKHDTCILLDAQQCSTVQKQPGFPHSIFRKNFP